MEMGEGVGLRGGGAVKEGVVEKDYYKARTNLCLAILNHAQLV